MNKITEIGTEDEYELHTKGAPSGIINPIYEVPVFPQSNRNQPYEFEAESYFTGLSKKEYTCIQLGVPETGDAELDMIIRKAQRRKYVSDIARTLSEGRTYYTEGEIGQECISNIIKPAVVIADALIEELESSRRKIELPDLNEEELKELEND